MNFLKRLFSGRRARRPSKEMRNQEVLRQGLISPEHGESWEPITDDFSQRNLKGIELEKKGNVDEAIEIYEKLAKEGFDGSHPYNRLAIIYRRQKQYDEEIRVLERAIEVYNVLSRSLDEFEKRLEKARLLKEKSAGS